MKVLTVIGLTATGKTTVIEALIRELVSRGYSVGTVKEIHFEAFRIDTPGKNTFRHREAGADTVTARAQNETDIMYTGHLPIYDILKHYKEDFIIMEGVRDALAPEIVLCKENETPAVSPLTLAVSGSYANSHSGKVGSVPIINALTDAARLADLVVSRVPPLMYDFETDCCGLCGLSCREMLSSIILGERDYRECALHKGKIELTINGKAVPMVPFVEKILGNAVKGVVSELKGYEQGGEIVIKIYGGE